MKKYYFILTLLVLICVINCLGKKYEPREITFDEINSQVPKTLICERSFEMPKNEEYAEALNNALSIADNEISIAKYLINNGLVKISYWNGRYSGSVIIKNPKIIYGFTLRVKDDKIISFRQVRKFVNQDKINIKGDLSKRIRINKFDNTNIVKTFTYGDLETKKYFDFYPNGNLKHCGIALSNKYYRGYWDENGSLTKENIRNKDWNKEKLIAEKRRAEFKKKSDERIQAGKDFVENHPELKKIMDEMTAIGEQGKEINKKLESDSYQESETLSMKEELKVLSNKYINCLLEFKKVQKQIMKEEKEK
jgi:hypothetical protein